MAFKEHPEFRPPANPHGAIWRYMDLAKFLSLIDSTSLFFARVDKLARLDAFEGYYTAINIQTDNLKFDEMPLGWRDKMNIHDERTFHSLIGSLRQSRALVKAMREFTFVNSWHSQDCESAAMWSLYVKSQEGVAVQSTFQRLITSLDGYHEFEIHVGMVKYIDYNYDVIGPDNLLLPFLHKRKSFEHEKELRALIWTPQHGKNAFGDVSQNKYKDQPGIYVPVDVEQLIDRVYVSPTAPNWFVDLLRSIVRRYRLEKEVTQSDLALTPVY